MRDIQTHGRLSGELVTIAVRLDTRGRQLRSAGLLAEEAAVKALAALHRFRVLCDDDAHPLASASQRGAAMRAAYIGAGGRRRARR